MSELLPMVPGQFHRTATSVTPEKMLAAAVLNDGLAQITKGVPLTTRHARETDEDLAWICSGDERELYSFKRLCLLFRLDPFAVREAVLSEHACFNKRAVRSGVTRGRSLKVYAS